MRKKRVGRKKTESGGHSIRHKILLLAAVAALPFVVMLVYLLFSMDNYSQVYDKIVRDITVANNYNLNFKEEMDESMYKLVVGYVTFDNISEDEKLRDPYELIEDLRSEFTELMDVTADGESRVWLASLLRNIDTLEKRVDDIVESINAGGTYDDNIENLENNIYVLTELVQDDIQYYIYYQTRSMEEVTDELNLQIRGFMVACAIALIVLIVGVTIAALLIASGITRPLKELNRATKKVAEGDLSARAPVTSRDEIAVLAEGFNYMAGNMQVLIHKIKEDEQKIRKTDLRLLQEQINPHFLYNTLDTIVWQIEGNEPDQAVAMVVALSNFFRQVLSKGKEFISIREEEQHISSYLEIQEMRYHDILEYDIQIDPSIYSCQILKLTLQPVVENALYHGIKRKRGKGMIHIKGKRDADSILFLVEDDGVGMDPEELDQLRKEIVRPCKETERGFGLANVNERIRMYFGEQYGLSITSKKGEGTIVEIRIPAIPNTQENSAKSSRSAQPSRPGAQEDS